MKYTLFFFFGILCFIELNALNLRPKSPVKISSQSTNNVHTKTGTSKIEIKGNKESHKPNFPIKTTTTTKTSTKTSTRTTSGTIKINPDRKKLLDKFKEKLKERIKHTMTDQEIKKIVDDIRKKMKHPVTDQEIKKIIDDLKKKNHTQ